MSQQETLYFQLPPDESQPQRDYCPYCDGLGEGSGFQKNYPKHKGPQQIFLQTRETQVLVDFAPLSTNHCLLTPIGHDRTFIFSDLGTLGKEFVYSLDVLDRSLLQQGLESIQFMHGDGQLVKEGGSVHSKRPRVTHDHYHHISIPKKMPAEGLLKQLIDKFSDENHRIIHLDGITNQNLLARLFAVTKNQPFLFFRIGESGFVVLGEDEKDVDPFESQTHRKIITEILYGENVLWKWKPQGNGENAVFRERIDKMMGLYAQGLLAIVNGWSNYPTPSSQQI